MPRKLLLHVGGHKTGTTAIQTALAQARPELEAAGILYPDLRQIMRSGPGNNHNKLFNGLAKSVFFGDFRIKNTVRSIVNQSENAALTILSSETIVRQTIGSPNKSDDTAWRIAHLNYLRKIKETLSSFDIKVVCYFRQPEQVATSLYKEMTVRNRPSSKLEFLEFLGAMRLHFDYPSRIRALETVFDELVIRSFAESVKSGLASSFLQDLNAPNVRLLDVSSVRSSPGDRATLWLQAHMRADSKSLYKDRVLFTLRNEGQRVLADETASSLWPDRETFKLFIEKHRESYALPFLQVPDANERAPMAQLSAQVHKNADEAFADWRMRNKGLLAKRKALALAFFEPDPE